MGELMRCPGKGRNRFGLALLSVGAIAGVGIVFGQCSVGEHHVPALAKAAWQAAPPASTEKTPNALVYLPPTTIEVDALRKEAADPEALRSLEREINIAPGRE